MAQESWKVEEEAAGCQLPEGPILCTNNCGFFGSVATMNLCSKCYREQSSKAAAVAAVAAPSTATLKGAAVAAAAATASQFHSPVVADQQQHAEVEETALISVTVPAKEDLSSSASVGGGGGAEAVDDGSSQEKQRPPNRCFACRKRIGLTGFKCRCGDVFCSMHRYSDKHNCSFDYKAAGREAIAKANPVVKADKVEKI